MTWRSLPVVAATVVMSLGVVSCAPATTTEMGQPAAREASPEIRVEHNAPLATSLTIHLVNQSGVRRRLGSVSPGQVETFRIDPPVLGGEYTLLAEAMDGRSLRSRPFTLLGRPGVRWDVERNTVLTLTGG
jgi:hypothetical protein